MFLVSLNSDRKDTGCALACDQAVGQGQGVRSQVSCGSCPPIPRVPFAKVNLDDAYENESADASGLR